jgi:hypothetical protein
MTFMKPWFIFFLFFLDFYGLHADESEGEDERYDIIVSDSDSEDDELEEEQSGCWHWFSEAMDALGTPKGATIITSVYGILQGTSNILWAVDWNASFNVNKDTSLLLQKIGGLSAAAECFVMGAVVPLMLHKYNQANAKAEAKKTS